MGQNIAKDRRKFIKGAAITAIVGTGAFKGSTVWAQSQSGSVFDQTYNRVGVNSIKWDAAIKRYGKDKIVVPMEHGTIWT